MRNEEKPRFRHELKYRMTGGEKEILVQKLKEVIRRDENALGGSYQIRSLYFDDFWNRAYEEKRMGTAEREKYRIRFYNYDDRVIKLECKHKRGSYIYKEAVSLTREETEGILRGEAGFLREKEGELCQRFYYQYTSRFLRPRVIVDYIREPFVYEPGDVRITFDREICEAAFVGGLFEKNLPVFPVMEPKELIMEVKYTGFLPDFIRRLLPSSQSDYTAASKYVMCYEKNRERYE